MDDHTEAGGDTAASCPTSPAANRNSSRAVRHARARRQMRLDGPRPGGLEVAVDVPRQLPGDVSIQHVA